MSAFGRNRTHALQRRIDAATVGDALADSMESARHEAAMLKCLNGDWVL